MDDKIELAVVCWQMFNSGLSGGGGGNIYIYICVSMYIDTYYWYAGYMAHNLQMIYSLL